MRLSRLGNPALGVKAPAAAVVANETVEAMLRRFVKTDKLNGEHLEYLMKLKRSGFAPRVIYDIGACTLKWTHAAKEVWPEAEIYVFEANGAMQFLYKSENLKNHIAVLSDREKMVSFYCNERRPVGSSYYREKSKAYPDDVFKTVTTSVLDSVVTQNEWPLPDLIHVDTCGSEKDILHGASACMMHAQYVLCNLQKIPVNEGSPGVEQVIQFVCGQNYTIDTPNYSNNGTFTYYSFKRSIPVAVAAPIVFSVPVVAPSSAASSSSASS